VQNLKGGLLRKNSTHKKPEQPGAVGGGGKGGGGTRLLKSHSRVVKMAHVAAIYDISPGKKKTSPPRPVAFSFTRTGVSDFLSDVKRGKKKEPPGKSCKKKSSVGCSPPKWRCETTQGRSGNQSVLLTPGTSLKSTPKPEGRNTKRI